MNFKNTAENLAIVIISASLGAYIGYTASIKSNKQSIELLTPTLVEAIKKETIKNEINHDIDLKIDKVKKSDSIKINITQIPTTEQKPTNVITSKKDSVCIPKGYTLIKIENLTRRQRKRLFH